MNNVCQWRVPKLRANVQLLVVNNFEKLMSFSSSLAAYKSCLSHIGLLSGIPAIAKSYIASSDGGLSLSLSAAKNPTS